MPRKVEIRQARVHEVSELLRAGREKNIGERIPYFNSSCFDRQSHHYIFFLAMVGKKIVGAGMLAPSQGGRETGWLCSRFVSVDKGYEGQGIASKLLHAIFAYCRDQGMSLVSSSYSRRGAELLKPLNHRLSREYGVAFRDPDMEVEEHFLRVHGRPATEAELETQYTRFP